VNISTFFIAHPSSQKYSHAPINVNLYQSPPYRPI
jgi:hypothetical protein